MTSQCLPKIAVSAHSPARTLCMWEMATLLATGQADSSAQEDRVDFLTALPLELVFHIVLYLELRHFLPCLSVSKDWHQLLSDMEHYWKRACLGLGLSKDMLGKLLTVQGTSKSVLFAAMRHRHTITGANPTCGATHSDLTYNMHYTCQYARGRQLVGTVYKDFRPHQMLVQSVNEDTVDVTHVLQFKFARVAENRIIWAHVYKHLLFCASASGIWCVYNLTSPAEATHPGVLLMQWRAESMYDPETTICCCDECGMICTAKMVSDVDSERALWEVRIVEVSRDPVLTSGKKWRLPLPAVTKFTLEANNTSISYRRIALGKKKASLLRNSTERNEQDFCSTHVLLLQWANDIAGHLISTKTEGGRRIVNIARSPVKTFTVECERSALLMSVLRNDGLNTEFTFSHDKTLIGMIFQSRLATWDTRLSSWCGFVDITLDSYQYEEMSLVSLGDVYSIVGLEFSGCVLVVGTRTGQQLLRFGGFADNHCHLHPPYIRFLCCVEQDWQSNISRPCDTKVVYWNKTKGAIEWVGLGVASSRPPVTRTRGNGRKRRRWWHRKE